MLRKNYCMDLEKNSKRFNFDSKEKGIDGVPLLIAKMYQYLFTSSKTFN